MHLSIICPAILQLSSLSPVPSLNRRWTGDFVSNVHQTLGGNKKNAAIIMCSYGRCYCLAQTFQRSAVSIGVRAFLIPIKQWLSPRWKHKKNRLMLVSYFIATCYFARGLSEFCFFHVISMRKKSCFFCVVNLQDQCQALKTPTPLHVRLHDFSFPTFFILWSENYKIQKFIGKKTRNVQSSLGVLEKPRIFC